jgi:hypothetical protein
MKTFVLMMLAAATCLAAEQQQKKKDAYDIRPEAAKSADAPTSEKWQLDNKAKLAEATKTEVLAAFVKDEASAAALLAEVKPEYKTCPVKAFQIAAVTQYVMTKEGAAGRKLWAKQLLAFAERADKNDVKMYFLDQLRWCGCKCQAEKVRALGVAASCKCVKDFATWVASELDNTAGVRAGF